MPSNYSKDKFTTQARSAKICGAFRTLARKCGFMAKEADGELEEGDIVLMCREAAYLMAELEAMRARLGQSPR